MQIATRQQKLITNVAKLPRLAPCSHGLSIILVALILCLPLLFSGIPIAGDVVTHVQYQRHFSEQFWAGELYPRWLMNANKGYGSPIFLVQYPVPYWTTALIRAVVRFQPGPGREARELGLFCFLAVAAAGLSARYWFTRRFGSLPATAAAILYMGLPYFVPFALYKSAAIGQLAAAAWMPLTLAAADSNLRSRASSTLALAVALLIMSNLITAALFLPLLVAYAIASGRSRGMSMSRLFGSVLLAVALGFGVAAVYILPAAIYRPLFDLNVWSFLTSSYFAFVRAGNLTVPIVVASLSAAIVVAGIAAYSIWTRRKEAGGPRNVWIYLAGSALAAGTAMAVPGFGIWFLRAGGLNAPILDIGHVYHPEKMLAITLSTFSLGAFAYCKTSKEALTWREKHAPRGGLRFFRPDASVDWRFVERCSEDCSGNPVSASVWRGSSDCHSGAVRCSHSRRRPPKRF